MLSVLEAKLTKFILDLFLSLRTCFQVISKYYGFYKIYPESSYFFHPTLTSLIQTAPSLSWIIDCLLIGFSTSVLSLLWSWHHSSHGDSQNVSQTKAPHLIHSETQSPSP